MTKQNRQKGMAAVIILYIVTVLGFTVVSLTTLSTSGMTRSKREVSASQAFQLAQAGVDYMYEQAYSTLEASHGVFATAEVSLSSTPVSLPTGASGIMRVT